MVRTRVSSSQRGVTLLEVMVAVGILAMVSTLVYGAFDGMARSRQGISRIDERYRQGRVALARMTRELQMAFLSLHQPQQIAASVRSTVFLGTDSGSSDRVDFTSFSHQRLNAGVHESDQNELSYFLSRDPNNSGKFDLVRREQREIDLEPTKGGVVSILAEDATAFELQYLDPISCTWVETWDSTQTVGQGNRLPLEVKIRLMLKGGPGDTLIKMQSKVTLAMQTPLNFAIARPQ